MNAYLRVIDLGVKQALEFRARILLWILFHLSPFIVVPFFWVYVLFEQTNGTYTPERITTYYILIVFIASLTASSVGNRVEEGIIEGGIVSFIIKPVSYIRYQFALFLGGKVVSSIIVIALFLLARIFSPEYILPPTSLMHGLFFIIFIGIALSITFFLEVLVSLGAFWWGRTPSLAQSLHWLKGLFGGQYAPLVFYPTFVVFIAKILPFQFLYAVPAGAYLGEYSILKMFHLFLIGTAWVCLLAFVSTFIWKKGIRTYDSPSQ
jgi:ABC-type uncharacterized transport system permease subunit